MKIGFFDSGLGGLTVLKESIRCLPNENYIYLADNLNAPYGVKDKNIVREYIFKNVEKLINKGAQIIVIACNTATSIAIDDLRAKYKSIKIIGIEPAVKPAIESVKDSTFDVLVTATSLTLKEEKLNNLISKLGGAGKTLLLPLDELVVFAESGNFDDLVIEKYLKSKIKNREKYGAVVLGCTHFSIFKHNFENIFTKDVKILDGNKGIVSNLKRGLKCSNKQGSVTIIMTKESKLFEKNVERILQINNIIYEKD